MSWERYPSPSFRRKKWMNLNGEWLLNGRKIIVPFCPEAKASEFRGEIGYGAEDCLVYEKNFELPEDMPGEKAERVLLHLDGVDQKFVALVNEKTVGGGHDGYTKKVFDITEALNLRGENALKVVAYDTLREDLPYGKQRLNHGGMWYTPVSGIWKNVWLECVPKKHIQGLCLDTTLSELKIRMNFSDFVGQRIEIRIREPERHDIEAEKNEDNREVIVFVDVTEDCLEDGVTLDLRTLTLSEGMPLSIKNWSPEEPWLYDMEIIAGEDRVNTYFGLRTINVEEINGKERICLNGKPIFLHGVLDQGYFAEGHILPLSEDEYEKDILRMKNLGFNLLRKHIKTEPDCFYTFCDRLGMLVMQDFVNSGHYSFLRDTAMATIGLRGKGMLLFKRAGEKQRMYFERHIRAVSGELHNHPSVIAYTIFNEGWGQHKTGYYYKLLKELDPGRLYDSASGWFRVPESDFDSRHIYFKLRTINPLKREKKKPILVTETGGYTYEVKEHTFAKKTYGYGECASRAALTDKIKKLYHDMIFPGVENGVCGCIYTQLSDVEEEINGIYTFDRKVLKVDADEILELGKEARELMDKYTR